MRQSSANSPGLSPRATLHLTFKQWIHPPIRMDRCTLVRPLSPNALGDYRAKFSVGTFTILTWLI